LITFCRFSFVFPEIATACRRWKERQTRARQEPAAFINLPKMVSAAVKSNVMSTLIGRVTPTGGESTPIAAASNKRKRGMDASVSFGGDRVHSYAEDLPLEETWLTKQSILDVCRSLANDVHQTKLAEPTTYELHTKLLAATYSDCVMHGDVLPMLTKPCLGTNESLHPVQKPQQQATYTHCLLGATSLDLRGLEACVLPTVSVDRRQRRLRHVATIVKAQVRLGVRYDEDTKADLIRQLSEKMTASSRAFAHALGAADSMASLMEHSTTSKVTMEMVERSELLNKAHLRNATSDDRAVEVIPSFMLNKIVSPMA
jgi:hypothetical protein